MYSTSLAPRSTRSAPFLYRTLLLGFATLVLTFGLASANAQTPLVLHVFETEDACDQSPVVEPGNPVYSGILAQALDGSIYSSTMKGGACGYLYGAAYQMSLSGTVKALHSFGFVGNEGSHADGGLTLGTDGNFYGTTQFGGSHNDGTIFMITPGGALTYLHNFNVTDGAYPTAPPIQGMDGYFYGTTSQGGTSVGAVYKMAPTSPWTVTTYAMPQYSYPQGPLIQGSDGYFYGTASNGGAHGVGFVFRMTSSGNVTIIYSFDTTNGSVPVAPLTEGSDGYLYGTASKGGDKNSDGVVFRLTKSGVITVMHQFNGADGSRPLGGLVQASNGSFYGVSSLGGINQQGTLYKLTPAGNTWSFSVLANFDVWGTGGQPQLTLLQHTNGKIYGDSNSGGTLIEEGSGLKFQGAGTFYSVYDTSLTPFIRPVSAGAKVGTSVTILGQGLTSATQVSFNGASATITFRSDTYLTAVVPTAASTGIVSVTTSKGILKSLKAFIVIPVITSFSPTSGKVNTQVVIQGSGLTGASQVTFGGVKATIFTVNSGSQVTATVPTGAKTGRIAITTAGGTAVSAGTFTVLP